MVGLACLPDLVASKPDADAAQANPCGDGVVDLDAEQCDPGADDAAFGCTQTCVVDCDGGVVDPATNHCYFWTTVTDSIDHAEFYCSLPSAHLVSFADQDELSFVGPATKNLANAPDGGGGSWAWLQKTGGTNDAGLETYYVPNTTIYDLPGWAASCPGCFANADGGDGGGFALAGQNPQLCVFWKKGPQQGWVQQVCTFGGNTVTPLCEREPPGAFSAPCADGGNTCIRVPRTSSTKRYELTATASTFDNARTACASRGGILAHFESGAEREEVIAEVARIIGPGGDVWIGLAFDPDAGAWMWDDGAPAPPVFPTPWADNEPSVAQGAATIHLELGRYDTRLARAQADTTATYRALCQLK
jgi:hypothetical protein